VFAFILSACMVAPSDGTEVDLLAFQCSPEIAACNLETANLHQREIISRIKCHERRIAWEWGQDNTRKAWRSLHRAMTSQGHERTKALADLKVAIGEEAYYAGRMPPPIPNYGPWIPFPEQ
jgi:hypothetical protein